MTRIAEIFGTARVLLPVVHPVSRQQALASIEVARGCGVRGIFLINQGMEARDVLELVNDVRRRHPTLWIGVNLLGKTPAAALEAALLTCERIDGIWSDNAGIDETAAAQTGIAADFLAMRRRHGWTGLYFGGVAFKYQREVGDLAAAARAAAPYVDVICTSGPGTGMAAPAGKPAALRAAVGPDVAIALASGVTAENVGDYLPYVDAYLVGTGIEASLGVLDARKVASLQARVG